MSGPLGDLQDDELTDEESQAKYEKVRLSNTKEGTKRG